MNTCRNSSSPRFSRYWHILDIHSAHTPPLCLLITSPLEHDIYMPSQNSSLSSEYISNNTTFHNPVSSIAQLKLHPHAPASTATDTTPSKWLLCCSIDHKYTVIADGAAGILARGLRSSSWYRFVLFSLESPLVLCYLGGFGGWKDGHTIFHSLIKFLESWFYFIKALWGRLRPIRLDLWHCVGCSVGWKGRRLDRT